MKLTLKDIVPMGSDYTAGSIKVSFYDGYGANVTLDLNSYGDLFETTEASKLFATFTYLSPVEAAEYSDENFTFLPGWYQEEDEDFTTPMDDFQIPLGSCVSVIVFDSDITVTYSGKLTDDIIVDCGCNKFVWAGNSTPVDLTLGDLLPSGSDYTAGVIKLSFYGGKAANVVLDKNDYSDLYDSVGVSTLYATFTYLSAAEAEEYSDEEITYAPGWYHEDDEDFAIPMNNYPVKAGLGFSLKSFEDGIGLRIPAVVD